ncbi:F0F1 ATP synthase subunit epsilon [Pseudodesulfovibrio tunisiensis]|uniref:F0F1 ATP synthase subunit epsilon n=1 Tax=Pseudodesulfovibrio tunisiensis TaxID=463192 RepID=UPI001FB47FE6|nr:F0F1 ATP synthase subunit epsilon [Pseudodesulfovibrio tunisiensis]
MRFKVLLPSRVLLDEEVVQVRAEGPNGMFTLRPRHIDMASSLVAGILTFRTPDGRDHHLAMDQGIVGKQGNSVTVASRMAVRGEMGHLEEEVRRMQDAARERERGAQGAVARLEADFVRRFLEFGKT